MRGLACCPGWLLAIIAIAPLRAGEEADAPALLRIPADKAAVRYVPPASVAMYGFAPSPGAESLPPDHAVYVVEFDAPPADDCRYGEDYPSDALPVARLDDGRLVAHKPAPDASSRLVRANAGFGNRPPALCFTLPVAARRVESIRGTLSAFRARREETLTIPMEKMAALAGTEQKFAGLTLRWYSSPVRDVLTLRWHSLPMRETSSSVIQLFQCIIDVDDAAKALGLGEKPCLRLERAVIRAGVETVDPVPFTLQPIKTLEGAAQCLFFAYSEYHGAQGMEFQYQYRFHVAVEGERVDLPFELPGFDLPAARYLPPDAPAGPRGQPGAQSSDGWTASLRGYGDVFASATAAIRPYAGINAWPDGLRLFFDWTPPEGVDGGAFRGRVVAASLVTDAGEALTGGALPGDVPPEQRYAPVADSKTRLPGGIRIITDARLSEAALTAWLPRWTTPADRAKALTVEMETILPVEWKEFDVHLRLDEKGGPALDQSFDAPRLLVFGREEEAAERKTIGLLLDAELLPDPAWAAWAAAEFLDADGRPIAVENEFMHRWYAYEDLSRWRLPESDAPAGSIPPPLARPGPLHRQYRLANMPARARVRVPVRVETGRRTFAWNDVPLPRAPGVHAWRAMPPPAFPPAPAPAVAEEDLRASADGAVLTIKAASGLAGYAGRAADPWMLRMELRPPAGDWLFPAETISASYTTDAGETVSAAHVKIGPAWAGVRAGDQDGAESRLLGLRWPDRPARSLARLNVVYDSVFRVDEWAAVDLPVKIVDGVVEPARAGPAALLRPGWLAYGADGDAVVTVDDDAFPGGDREWARLVHIERIGGAPSWDVRSGGQDRRAFDAEGNWRLPVSLRVVQIQQDGSQTQTTPYTAVRVRYPVRGERRAFTFAYAGVPLPTGTEFRDFSAEIDRAAVEKLRGASYTEARPMPVEFLPEVKTRGGSRPDYARVTLAAAVPRTRFLPEWFEGGNPLRLGAPGDFRRVVTEAGALAASALPDIAGPRLTEPATRAFGPDGRLLQTSAYRLEMTLGLPLDTAEIKEVEATFGLYRVLEEATLDIDAAKAESEPAILDRDGWRATVRVQSLGEANSTLFLEGKLALTPEWKDLIGEGDNPLAGLYRIEDGETGMELPFTQGWSHRAGDNALFSIGLNNRQLPKTLRLRVASKVERVLVPFRAGPVALPADPRLPADAPAGPRGERKLEVGGLLVELQGDLQYEGYDNAAQDMDRKGLCAYARGAMRLEAAAADVILVPDVPEIAAIAENGVSLGGFRRHSVSVWRNSTGERGASFTLPFPSDGAGADRFASMTLRWPRIGLVARKETSELYPDDNGEAKGDDGVAARRMDMEELRRRVGNWAVIQREQDALIYEIRIPLALLPEGGPSWKDGVEALAIDVDGKEWPLSSRFGLDGTETKDDALVFAAGFFAYDDASRQAIANPPERLIVAWPAEGRWSENVEFTFRDLALPRRPRAAAPPLEKVFEEVF